jgi:hypothetical protein
MVKLLAGVLLWSLAHLFKRLAPTFRQGMGDTGKLVVTLALIGSLVLMSRVTKTPQGQFGGCVSRHRY